ncbi:MAG TPA: hypothetical protein VFF06_19820 [Polyangia bacterium]|nr:hypothetical protein [Polyangia bacterium]
MKRAPIASVAVAVAAFAALVSAACGPRSAKWPVIDPALGPAPPRAETPGSTATANVTRPRFTWTLAPGTDGARLELCRDENCKQALEIVDGATNAVPTQNLPTGVVYWWLRGKQGTRVGAVHSPVRRLTVEAWTEHAGRNVQIAAPWEEQRAAEALAKLGDQALGFFAQVFGRPLPRTPIPIFLYGTPNGYSDALRELGRGRHVHAFAFTAWPGVAHLPFYPRVGRPLAGGPGKLESALLHELAHTYQVTQFQHYNDEPLWLREGLAELLAERVFEIDEGPSAATLPPYTARILAVRDALDSHRFIPLKELFDIERDLLAGDVAVEKAGVFYAEAYSLLAMLDSPANPERQKKLRAFLHDELALSGFLLAARINRRFRALFGEPAALERELVSWIRAQPVLEWELKAGDLRLLDGGGLMLDTASDQRSLVLEQTPASGEFAVDAEIERDADGAREAMIVIGYRGAKDFYVVDYIDGGRILLAHFDGKWTRIATRGTGANLLPAETRIKLSVEVNDKHVVASMNDQEMLSADLPTAPAGRWGIGCVDGHLVFHAAKRRNVNPPTADAR